MNTITNKISKISDDDISRLTEYAYKIGEKDGFDEQEIDVIGCFILPGLDDDIVIISNINSSNYKNYHVRILNKSFKTGVKLTTSEYFHYGSCTDIFTNEQAKAFDEIMREDIGGSSRWEFLKFFYNNEYTNRPLGNRIKQPDYSKLNESHKKGNKKWI